MSINKVVIASDSFKGSLGSRQVADSAAAGVAAVFPDCEIVSLGIADGGEGTMDSLTGTLGGEIVTVDVCDPLMRRIKSRYAILSDNDTAIIEMAEASGLTLLAPEERNPMLTSSFGTGQLIADALRHGCRKILICLGGSATNDAGTGLLSALGINFHDRTGQILEAKGESLNKIAGIDCSGLLEEAKDAEFLVACDVDTLFYGSNGAARVFAPQKGADEKMVECLDEGLRNFAKVVKAQLGVDMQDYAGAGAAGGIGGALKAILGARLIPGIDLVLDTIQFDRIISGADIIITGEGRMDFQTAMGKTPAGVLKRAKLQSIPVIAIAGAVRDRDALENMGFEKIAAVTPADMDIKTAMREDVASENIRRTVVGLLESI